MINAGPVNIGSTPVTFEAPEILEVITPGAHLLLEISELVKAKGIIEVREKVGKLFPDGCVVARMSGVGIENIILDRQSVSWSEDTIYLQLSAAEPISTNLEFSRVTLSSCYPIEQTTVIWVNYKH